MNVLKEKLWTWGYVLDHVPTSAPFVFGKTRCSLETAAAYLDVKRTFYMNTMFSPKYIAEHFPTWDKETLDNAVVNRLSEEHWQRLASMKSIYATLEHDNYVESAEQIALASLRFKNIVGIHFDDFNPVNGGKVFHQVCDKVKSINPALKIAVVTYSHQNNEDFAPFVSRIDLFSRWCWVASQDYWDRHAEHMKRFRDFIGEGKTLIQGIYLHDFGSDMQCRYPVPLEIFQKSVRTLCDGIYNGTIDGAIIPQSGWFSAPRSFRTRFLDETLSGLVRRNVHRALKSWDTAFY